MDLRSTCRCCWPLLSARSRPATRQRPGRLGHPPNLELPPTSPRNRPPHLGRPGTAATRRKDRRGRVRPRRRRDDGPQQLCDRLGPAARPGRRAAPTTDVAGARWSAAVVEAARARPGELRTKDGGLPDLDARRAAEALGDRFGLDLDPDVLVELAHLELIPKVGHDKGSLLDDGRALERFDDRAALERAARRGRLRTADAAACLGCAAATWTTWCGPAGAPRPVGTQPLATAPRPRWRCTAPATSTHSPAIPPSTGPRSAPPHAAGPHPWAGSPPAVRPMCRRPDAAGGRVSQARATMPPAARPAHAHPRGRLGQAGGDAGRVQGAAHALVPSDRSGQHCGRARPAPTGPPAQHAPARAVRRPGTASSPLGGAGRPGGVGARPPARAAPAQPATSGGRHAG
jgi:hypothetical protein